MKLQLLSTFVATIFYVAEAKKLKMAGMNGGMMQGMNGGMVPGMNGGMMQGMNGGMMPGMNRGMMVRGGNPGMMGGGMMGGGMMGGGMMGGGFMGPQFGQMVPGMGGFAMQPQAFPAAPFGVPNMAPPQPFPGVPFMAAPQMAAMNPQQQQLMGLLTGALQQQAAPPGPLKRFKRRANRPPSRQANSVQPAVETQIPVPTEAPPTTTPCNEPAP